MFHIYPIFSSESLFHHVKLVINGVELWNSWQYISWTLWYDDDGAQLLLRYSFVPVFSTLKRKKNPENFEKTFRPLETKKLNKSSLILHWKEPIPYPLKKLKKKEKTLRDSPSPKKTKPSPLKKFFLFFTSRLQSLSSLSLFDQCLQSLSSLPVFTLS